LLNRHIRSYNCNTAAVPVVISYTIVANHNSY